MTRNSFPLPLAAAAAGLLAAAAGGARAVAAPPLLDTLTFGDAASEGAHAVAAPGSEVVTGGLGRSARRLLPQSPPAHESGSLDFSLKVDPRNLTYVTFKFWGGDRGEESGRLFLFSEGRQIGYRREGDYDVVNQADDVPLYPGRFVYVTLPLPPQITEGRERVSLSLRALGRMWPYGQTFAQYQKPLAEPTRGIYAAYTHTDPYFAPPASEAQGEPPPAPPPRRPAPGPEVMDAVRARVNAFLAQYAAAPPTVRAPGSHDPRNHHRALLLLADAYNTPWTSVHKSPAALERVIGEGDALAAGYAADPRLVTSDWPGAGPLGEALLRLHPVLKERLDETIPLADGTKVARRRAWADALRGSVDHWRTHRRFYTNQSMIVDGNLYAANEGLRLIDPSRALPKARALRYVYEAVGIEPWRGSDPADLPPGERGGGADQPEGGFSTLPYGRDFHLVTRKGLSRELGYVAGYGETILYFVGDMARLTGDPKLVAQLRKLAEARTYFRYPLPDADGYRAMVLEGIIDNRVAHYPSAVAYGASHGARETEPLAVAALTRDPRLVGVARQMLEDNQFFALLASRLANADPHNIRGLMHSVDDYAAVRALPPGPHRLPMTDGQPDFVWADEENGVVAIKHGDRRLFVNFYYRAERAVNGVARIHDLTPRVERIVTAARTQVGFVPSGETYVRPDWVDGLRGPGIPYPGPPILQAWAGERMPIAKRPDDATLPRYGDWGPFVGKADFYGLHYGEYVLGANGSRTTPYDLAVPAGVTGAKDLVTGRRVTVDGGKLRVAPGTTVVLWLGK